MNIKNILVTLMAIVIMLTTLLPSFAAVRVKGYFRSNGTYVAPHYRSSPNSSIYDNWSTKGNINPYTGQYGSKNVYPSYSYTPNYNYPNFTPSFSHPSAVAHYSFKY